MESKKNKLVRLDGVKLPSATALNVTLKEIQVTGEWKWVEGRGDTCGICRAAFEGCCVDCKMPGDECPIILGVCSHAFHMHCIIKWTNSQVAHQRPACPLCRQEWRYSV
ncbi:unnamed protein product [Bursaphelenchus okinawaensis]|uniref:Anaphase-promoting complex subunit 11 n=1 Tax=Bursaphelenchus okinawaensis TaxID=465554 RepID=A0A811KXD4_9BILA|nr:unnamed protein product [Bursaphelenchus okinawaensis]CAG9113229.1 unnamed protein product [Bursaphelenchus okinawaensis]